MCVCVVLPTAAHMVDVCYQCGASISLSFAYPSPLSLGEDVGRRIKSVMLSNPAGRLHDFSPPPRSTRRGVGEEWPTFALMTAEMHELHEFV